MSKQMAIEAAQAELDFLHKNVTVVDVALSIKDDTVSIILDDGRVVELMGAIAVYLKQLLQKTGKAGK